ncbi:uncharacterized protein VTP21DRAFT_3327 [Calcarisporiella thermophila]|uniref:uncharacterized protein n=1 Tax=Calcarisporiella thermophila TaxID=911321 RepID=UPI0037431EE8
MTRVAKIFWPSHICSPRTRSGFLVGWNVRGLVVCVATVVSDIKIVDLESVLSTFSTESYHSFMYMNQMCGAQPEILGVCRVLDDDWAELKCEEVSDRRQSAKLWITVDINDLYIPKLSSIYNQGLRFIQISTEVIFYKQPKPISLQYLSASPLVLDISAKPKSAQVTKDEAELATLRNMELVFGHSHALYQKKRVPRDEMSSVLHQINSSFEVETAVLAAVELKRKQRRRPRNIIETMRDSGLELLKSLQWSLYGLLSLLWQIIRPFIVHPLMVILFMLRVFAEVILWFLNLKMPLGPMKGISLKDLSACGQQIDLRLQQICFWPWQYVFLRKRDRANTAATRAQYISFYNNMWLVANDIILGVTLGSYLINNNQYVVDVMLQFIDNYTIARQKSMIHWLMACPAGLKLNDKLGSFLGHLFLWLIELWSLIVIWLRPYAPTVIQYIGYSGIFGATMVLSLISDLIALITAVLYWVYMVAARIYNWQFIIILSLFNLFRGKKRNPLRNRIDSCDYDLDQLLLGTVLFTLLTFLFPTIAVYYATFAADRICVIFLQVLLETVLACLNHFPLFAIMLRFKDPDRLSGGLRLEICPEDYFYNYQRPLLGAWRRVLSALGLRRATRKQSSWRTTNTMPPPSLKNGMIDFEDGENQVSYIFMWNLPIPLSAIFFQYMLLWKRLSSHYCSWSVVRCFFLGETIRPSPRLQYPMLPETRPNLMNFWLFLKTSFAVDES